MTPSFAEAVDPIFLYVIGLLDRIAAGENPSPLEERLHVRGGIDQAEARLGKSADWQLAKYALVVWIDEVLIEATWTGREWWNENALEVDLFNSRLANEQFYIRSKEAAQLSSRDALEVFYVCVVLGFRGIYRDPIAAATLAGPRDLPADLDAWAKQTSLSIRLGQGRPTISDVGSPGSGAPPLVGQSNLIWSALIGTVLAAFTLITVWITFAT